MKKRKMVAGIMAVAAFGAALTAHAAYWAWNGSSASPSYWDDLSLWIVAGSNAGAATFDVANHNFKEKYSTGKAFASGWDRTVTFRNLFTQTYGDVSVSAGTPQEPIVFVAENAECGIFNAVGNLILDGESASDPCLHILSGTYRFNNLNIATYSGTNGTLKVSGGTVTATNFTYVGKTGTGFLDVSGGEVVSQKGIGVGYDGGTGYLNVSGGTVSSGAYLFVGYGGPGYLNISGGLVKNAANYIQIGASANCTGTVTVTSDGTYENLEGNGSITVGHAKGSVGLLNVQGGRVTTKGNVYLCYNASAISAAVNVTDGGILTVAKIFLDKGGVEGGTVTVDGGTIRAYASNASFMPAHAKLRVWTGANGATFDADAFDITIDEDIDDKPGETGCVTFTGDGGTVRLTGTLNYTGATYLDQKAHLVVKDRTMLESLLSKGLTVVGSAKGTYTILSIADGTPCTAADYARIAKAAGLANATFGIDENGAITISASHFAQTWSGAAGVSAPWSGPNWDGGATFDVGNDAVFATAGAVAEVDADTEAYSLTFSQSAVLAGTAILTVPTVSVAANAEAVISAPTAGQLEKTGPGTLTLGTSRADFTVLSEGTLAMADGTSLDWSKLTFGTDAQKPVALRLASGATLVNIASSLISLGDAAGSTEELYKEGGDMATLGVYLASGENATTRYFHGGGTHEVGAYCNLGNNANSDRSVTYFEISGGTVTNTANYLSVGRRGNAGCVSVMTVKSGGTYGTCANMVVGYEASGVLNVDGGDVLVGNGNVYICYDAKCGAGEDSAVNLTQGGTLTAKQVRYGASNTNCGSAPATLRFDGGTLRAAVDSTAFIPAHANLTVTVDAGGGTIDADGHAVTVAEDLSGAGGMTYVGGGKVTLSKAPAYSGKTTVEVGTQLVVPSPLAGANLAFTAPAGGEAGLFASVAISGGGTFADGVVGDVAKPEGFTVRLSADKKTVYCGDSAGKAVWVGGTSASLNDGGNWLSGSVPDGGDAIIGVQAATTLANPAGSAFAATSITFPSYSAKVTIGGAGAIEGLLAITNNAAQHHVFNVPVAFAEGVTASVTMSEDSYMDFAGGVTMRDLDTSGEPQYCGAFTVTTDGDWNAGDNSTLMEDSELNLPNGTYYDLAASLTVARGASLTVKNVRMDQGGDNSYKYLLKTNNGVVKVLDEVCILTSPSGNYILSRAGGAYLELMRGSGAFVLNKLRMDDYGLIIAPLTTVVGPGGIVRGDGNGIVRMLNSGTHTFGSNADWAMCKNGETDASDPVFIKQGGEGKCTLTFDTSDWSDATVPRRIACRAPICGQNAAQAGYIALVVKGCGEFAFETSYDDASSWKVFAGGLTVTDAATVSVKPGCNPGKGDVTLGGGTTLKVAGSGTAALGGALTLADGATLAFDFTERKVTPVLVATSGATAEGTVNVKVSSAGNVRPVGGKHVLTTGGGFAGKTVALVSDDLPHWMAGGGLSVNGDGNIVLSVVSDGTIMVLR